MSVKNEKYVSFRGPLSHDQEDRVSATDGCRQALSCPRASVSSLRLQPSSVFVAGSGSVVIPRLRCVRFGMRQKAKGAKIPKGAKVNRGMRKQVMFVTYNGSTVTCLCLIQEA